MVRDCGANCTVEDASTDSRIDAASDSGPTTFSCDDSDTGLVVTAIDPNAIDNTVATDMKPHRAVLPLVGTPSRLFVMLPGTFGSTDGYSTITNIAAKANLAAIGLQYRNEQLLVNVCRGNLNCFDPVRNEIFTGENSSPDVDIPAPESIHSLLLNALNELAKDDPRWNIFVENDNIDWSRVVLAGHSQGATHASYIARKFALNRVLMLSGGADGDENGLAPWITTPSATPAERFYGLAHQQEPTIDDIRFAFSTIGMTGELQVPSDEIATSAAQVLISDEEPAGMGLPALRRHG